jgi:hypothetical protein
MAFSIIGLFLGFAVYWILHRKFPDFFEVEPLPLHPRASRGRLAVIAFCLSGVIAGLAWVRPNFSLQQMNYQTEPEKALTLWFFTHLKSVSPLVQIYEGRDVLAQAAGQKRFADAQGIGFEGVGAYVPPATVQAANWRTWTERFCPGPSFTPTERKFFAPFLKSIDCGGGPAPLVPGSGSAGYLHDFSSGERWVSLWYTANDMQTAQVKAAFPGAVSLPEIVNLFPRLVGQEAVWMTVIGILLASLLLWNYYRDAYLVGLSLVPFFTGVGLFAWMAVLFQFEVGFVSLIALVMIFGLSLDYGIFAANLFTGRAGPSPEGVWTSVVLAATVTFLGFLPLAFCHHPVLVQLGQALVWGTLGTILGSMWGVPCCHRLLKGGRS